MLRPLAAAGRERQVWWLSGARGPDEHPFAAEAHALLASLPHAHERIFYSAAAPTERHRAHAAPRPDHPAGAGQAAHPGHHSVRVHLRACVVHDRHARRAVRVRHRPGASIFTELFGALDAINPGLTGPHRPRPRRPPGPPGTGPQVTFTHSGISTQFGDAWRGVLDLADACDVPTRWSCRTGVCHTFINPLLSGDISYHPRPARTPRPTGRSSSAAPSPRSDLVLDM